MGDMREVFDQHRQVDKERKLTGAVRNRQQLNDAGISTEAEQSNGALKFTTSVGTVMFYMTTGRWTLKNKTFTGGAQSFVNWAKKNKITL